MSRMRLLIVSARTLGPRLRPAPDRRELDDVELLGRAGDDGFASDRLTFASFTIDNDELGAIED